MNKMTNWLERTELLLSAQSMQQLKDAHAINAVLRIPEKLVCPAQEG